MRAGEIARAGESCESLGEIVIYSGRVRGGRGAGGVALPTEQTNRQSRLYRQKPTSRTDQGKSDIGQGRPDGVGGIGRRKTGTPGY